MPVGFPLVDDRDDDADDAPAHPSVSCTATHHSSRPLRRRVVHIVHTSNNTHTDNTAPYRQPPLQPTAQHLPRRPARARCGGCPAITHAHAAPTTNSITALVVDTAGRRLLLAHRTTSKPENITYDASSHHCPLCYAPYHAPVASSQPTPSPGFVTKPPDSDTPLLFQLPLSIPPLDSPARQAARTRSLLTRTTTPAIADSTAGVNTPKARSSPPG